VPVVPCNIGRFAVRAGDRFSAFDPHRGTITIHGRAPSMEDGPMAALILVECTEIDRVVRVVLGDADDHCRIVVTQRGALSCEGRSAEGLRVMIFQTSAEVRVDDFRARAVSTAERLLGELKLAEAIVELQVRGARSEVLGIVR
jgi:hypothetical protein